LCEDAVGLLLDKYYKKTKIDFYELGLSGKMNLGSPYDSITSTDIDSLSGSEFEEYLEKVFSVAGYHVKKTPLSNDQGADLILEKNSKKIAVQAKRYSGKVSNKAVQEVVSAIKYHNCNRGIVVTTGRFTKSAKQLATANGIELWDRDKLESFIHEMKI